VNAAHEHQGEKPQGVGEKPGPEYVWPDGCFYRLSGVAVMPPVGLLDATKPPPGYELRAEPIPAAPWAELTDDQRAVIVLLLVRAERVGRQRFKVGRRPQPKKPKRAADRQAATLLRLYQDDARQWLASTVKRREEGGYGRPLLTQDGQQTSVALGQERAGR
jgi:hypothetical protein